MKKLLAAVATVLCMALPTTAYASPATTNSISASTTTQSAAPTQQAQQPSNNGVYLKGRSGGGYHSGYRAPSSRVGQSQYTGSYTSTGRTGGFGGFGSHLFSFGSGMFLGSMFHPFGGYYGYGYHGFSIFSLLIDILLLYIAWRVIRRFMRR